MSSESEYRRSAAASLESSKGAPDLAGRIGRLIVAEAWIDLADQTTELAGSESGEAHRLLKQPLSATRAAPTVTRAMTFGLRVVSR
jgi:hypothetical protein